MLLFYAPMYGDKSLLVTVTLLVTNVTNNHGDKNGVTMGVTMK